MKTRLLTMFTIGMIGFTAIPYSFAACAAETMEWWEPCNDAGQNDILSFKATLLIAVLVIITITIIFSVINKWRKRK